MVQSFNVNYVIYHTINTILKRLCLSKAPFVLYTDLFFLYQCLIQINNTNKKRLIINLITLKQFYENKEIDDIR